MKLVLGLCNNQPYLLSEFFYAFQRLIKPQGTIVIRGMGTIKSIQLNEITMRALDEFQADYIMYLDVDMYPSVDTIVKLLSHDLPVVGGLYHLKNPPYSPIAGWLKDEGNNKKLPVNNEGKFWKENYARFPDSENGLVEVDWTGIGCLLVKKEVFKHIPYPPFWDNWNYKRGTRQKGHDINFCDWIRKAGYKVYIDRTFNCCHMGLIGVGQTYVDSYYESQMDKVYQKNEDKEVFEQPYWDRAWAVEDSRDLIRYCKDDVDCIKNHIPEGSKVLDVGCGQGALLKILQKEKKCDVEGWDFSSFVVSFLKGNKIPVRKVDLRTFSPDGDKNKYDVVTACQILEHMDDDKGLIEKLKEILKDRGQIIINVPAYEYPKEHKRSYTEQTLRELLQGFKNITIEKTCQVKEKPHLIGTGQK